MYEYAATLGAHGVYDGDTVHLDLDQGLRQWNRDARYRLARIDCPEMRSADGSPNPAGIAARDALIAKLGPDPSLVVRTIKDREDDRGRYLVEIELAGENVNDWLLANGWAVPYTSRKTKE